jgi:hypothetical protein
MGELMNMGQNVTIGALVEFFDENAPEHADVSIFQGLRGYPEQVLKCVRAVERNIRACSRASDTALAAVEYLQECKGYDLNIVRDGAEYQVAFIYKVYCRETRWRVEVYVPAYVGKKMTGYRLREIAA